MNDRGPLRAKTKQVAGAIVVLAMFVMRAVFASGVPSTWRLRLIVRSKSVRRECQDAEEQLRARLASIAETYSLRLVLSQVIDQCSRSSPISLGLDGDPGGGGAALTGHLRIVAYFSPQMPIDQAVPEIIDRLPPRRLYEHRDDLFAPKPKPDSPGPCLVFDGQDYAQLDWDIPGSHLMAKWALPKDRHLLRQHVSNDPTDMSLDRARQTYGPLVAWIVSTHYYMRPKRRVPVHQRSP